MMPFLNSRFNPLLAKHFPRLNAFLRERRINRDLRKLRKMQFVSGLGESSWLLYGLVKSLKPSTCVEIGSSTGKSTLHIGMALREQGFGKLYAIDPHTPNRWSDIKKNTYGILLKNIGALNLGHFIQVITKTSGQAAAHWDKPIDFLFIDGDHSYEGIKTDWDGYSKFVREDGVIVFHDTYWDYLKDKPYYAKDIGVPTFLEELRNQGFPVLTISKDFGLSLLQPVKGSFPLIVKNTQEEATAR